MKPNHMHQGQTDLELIYCETKEIQKKMSMALQQFNNQYQRCVQQMAEIRISKIKQIHIREETIRTEIEVIKRDMIQQIEKDWQQFKGYSRTVRKIYLGEGKQRLPISFSVHSIKQQIANIQISCQQIQGLIFQFQSELYPYIRTALNTERTSRDQQKTQNRNFNRISKQTMTNDPQLKDRVRETMKDSIVILKQQTQKIDKIQKLMTVQSIQISPIKSISKPKRDQFPNSMLQVNTANVQQNNKTSNRQIDKHQNNFAETEQVNQKQLKETVNVQQQAKPNIKIINLQPHSDRFDKIRSKLQKIDSPKTNIMSSHKKRFQPSIQSKRFTLNINSNTIRNGSNEDKSIIYQSGISRVKSDPNFGTKKGYKNCLQILQKQQLQYDKFRQGIK